MTDWLYEASNAQARVDELTRELNKKEKQLLKYYEALHLIATDPIIINTKKMKTQLEHFQNIAQTAISDV